MPCAVLYARVSSADQRHDLQLDELREHARLRGFDVVAEYQDTISGSRDRRPGRAGGATQAGVSG